MLLELDTTLLAMLKLDTTLAATLKLDTKLLAMLKLDTTLLAMLKLDTTLLTMLKLDITLLAMLKLGTTLAATLKLEVGSCRRRGGLGAVSRRVVWPSVRRSTGNSPCALLQLDTLLEVDIALMVSLAATNLLDKML